MMILFASAGGLIHLAVGHAMVLLIILAVLIILFLILMLTGLIYLRFAARGTASQVPLVSPEQILNQASATDDAHPWQRYWGESYGTALKQRLLKPVFDQLESEDKIGNLIVDVGSGALPVTQLLGSRPGRKRIWVDIAADNVASPDVLRIRLDAEKVGQFEALSFRKAILRAGAFLELDLKTAVNPEAADTIVFSDILNYVDFRKVLRGFAHYLKPEGRIIVINLPFRGNRSLFSAQGLRDNGQLYAFLEEHHFKVEHIAFPKKAREETDESEEFIVLVGRKCVPPKTSP